MKKMKTFHLDQLIYTFCLIFACCFFSNTMNAQCTTTAPNYTYSDLNTAVGGIAPCGTNCGQTFYGFGDPNTGANPPFGVYGGEGYWVAGFVPGTTYTFSICPTGVAADDAASGAGTWVPDLAVAEFGFSAGVGATVASVAGNCTMTFTPTALATDTLIFVITNPTAGCGVAFNTDNGVPQLSAACSSANGAACLCNSDLTCDVASGENFCGCTDCASLCSSAQAVFADVNPIAISASPVVYCEAELTGTSNPTPAAVYIPIAPFNSALPDDLACVTWDISTSSGMLYGGTPFGPITTVDNFVIFYLRVTDADIAAATNTIITFSASGSVNPCSFTFPVDLSGTILQDDGTAWAGSANAQCGCVTPTLTLDYDCATESMVFSVTDPGSGGFDITVPGSGLPAQTIGATVPMDYTFGPLPANSTYGFTISDGVTAGCDIIAPVSAVYPDCRVPQTGCTDIILEGGFDVLPVTSWVETADTNGVAIVPAGNIVNWAPNLGTGSAYLGGWGSVGTSLTSISQTVTIPAGTTTLYFWGLLNGCDSPADVATLTVDGTAVWTINGGDATCGEENWLEYLVDLTVYADGGAHTITMSMVEASANGGSTGFFIDEFLLENCAVSSCPTDWVLDNTEVGSTLYEASNSITSTDVVLMGEQVDYQAGNFIDLLSMFEVEANTDFHAYILDCSAPRPTAVEKTAVKNATVINKNKLEVNNFISNHSKNNIITKKMINKQKRNRLE